MIKKTFIIVAIIFIAGLSGIVADRYLFPRLAATKLFSKYDFLKKSTENVTVINKTEQILVKEDSSITKITGNITTALVNVVSYREPNPVSAGKMEQFKNGTGQIVTSDGIILTHLNALLAPGEANAAENIKYKVMTHDGNLYDAEISGVDSWSNLVFLKINASNLPVISFGEASAYSPGEKVVAIGNNSVDYQNHYSTGVLNAYDTHYNVSSQALSVSEKLEGVYQIDFGTEKLSPGDLIVDYSGRVVGITGMTVRNNAAERYGISSEKIKKVLEKAIGKNLDTNPYLGIYYVPISKSYSIAHDLPVNKGALIFSPSGQQGLAVIAGSPAQKAGLQINDIITHVGGKELMENVSLSGALYELKKGDKTELKVLRDGKEVTVPVQL